MIWIVLASVLAVFTLYILCLLIAGGRADGRKDMIFADRTADNGDAEAAAAPMPGAREGMPEELA